MSAKPKAGTLRAWWIPQVPGVPFHVEVATPYEAKKLLSVLADYDLFQFNNRIKPDYCNAGGLECFSQDGDYEWCEWYDEETGEGIDDWMPEKETP